MEAKRAFGKLERFLRHDDEGRKRTSAGSLAIATVTVKHEDRFGRGFVANRAASASASEGCGYFSHIILCIVDGFCSFKMAKGRSTLDKLRKTFQPTAPAMRVIIPALH